MKAIAYVSLACFCILSACNQNAATKWSDREDRQLQGTQLSAVYGTHEQRLAGYDEYRESAIRILRQATMSDVAVLRANAIEAFKFAPEYHAEASRLGLADEVRGVRFAAAISIGMYAYCDEADLLLPLLHDESDSVRAAAIYSLHKCGRDVDMNPLAKMVMSDDPEVRGNVAFILGELREPSAAPLLRSALGRGLKRVPTERVKAIELQFAEALVKLGYEDNISVIRSYLFLPPELGEVTALACRLCGELRDFGALADLMNIAGESGIYRKSIEIRLAAAHALAKIDATVAPRHVVEYYLTDEREIIRHQAALALGAIGDTSYLPSLQTLMSDISPLVQVAAAAAVLEILAN